MHTRRVVRLDPRVADIAPQLFTNEVIGEWFRLPPWVLDDVELMDALREPLSRRICLAGTSWGTLLLGLEDAWSWLFYGRRWLELQVQTKAEGRMYYSREAERKLMRGQPRCVYVTWCAGPGS